MGSVAQQTTSCSIVIHSHTHPLKVDDFYSILCFKQGTGNLERTERTNQNKMHIRPLEPADLPRTADILAVAMLDDELFEYLCPARKEHYSDFRNFFLRRQKLRLSTPGWVLRVAVTDAGDWCAEDEGGRIVGYAAWERMGDDPDSLKWKSHNSGWDSSMFYFYVFS